jgi:hypothetical protein
LELGRLKSLLCRCHCPPWPGVPLSQWDKAEAFHRLGLFTTLCGVGTSISPTGHGSRANCPRRLPDLGVYPALQRPGFPTESLALARGEDHGLGKACDDRNVTLGTAGDHFNRVIKTLGNQDTESPRELCVQSLPALPHPPFFFGGPCVSVYGGSNGATAGRLGVDVFRWATRRPAWGRGGPGLGLERRI